MTQKNDFWTRERECERYFVESGPFFMVTTQQLPWLLYTSDEEFMVGTNLVATSLAGTETRMLDEIQMNNHMHLLMEGLRTEVEIFVQQLHKRMRRYQRSLGRPSLKEWNTQLLPVTDLRQFRNTVAYIDRNAYVARLDSTPTGYPWGCGNLFFNRNLGWMQPGIPFGDLPAEQKRKVCRSHETDLPDRYRVWNGMILRRSFVDYKRTERFFNSANQYFSLLTRHGEADVELARQIGERIMLPNEEVFGIVAGWFPGTPLRQWDLHQRVEAAKRMKRNLSSNNKQIAQVLRLPLDQENELFPAAQ